MENPRDKIVAQLKAYGQFLTDHAESIVGDMEDTYLYEGGLNVSFNVSDAETPMVHVSWDYMPKEVLDVWPR